MALRKIDKTNGEGDSRAPAELKDCPLAILKVTATWCGPCKRIQPEFVRLCGSYSAVASYALDLDAAQKEGGDVQQLLEVLDISALPTFVAFNRGVEFGRVKGASIDDVTQLFEALVASLSSSSPEEPAQPKIHDAK